jgi:hypothetical protein
MVAQKTRRTSPAIRAYEQADQYIVAPATPERNDWDVIKRDGTHYRVDLDGPRCNCRAFVTRHTPGTCKHIELVRLHVAADAPAPFRDDEELTPEYAAQLTAELQAETDAELDRIARERRAQDEALRALWD